MNFGKLPPLPVPAATSMAYEPTPPGHGGAMFPAGSLRPAGLRSVGFTDEQMRSFAEQAVAPYAVALRMLRGAVVLQNRAGAKWEGDAFSDMMGGLSMADDLLGPSDSEFPPRERRGNQAL